MNIAAERMKNESDVLPLSIEKVLRSYVYLGTNKKIIDFSSLLSEDDKDVIINAVVDRTQDFYSMRPEYGKTYTTMEILENLSYQGLANGNIARPRAAQESFEAQLIEAHKNDKNPIEQGVQNFFNVVKSGIEAALKGLGISIPLELIIGAAALLVILLLTRSPHMA